MIGSAERAERVVGQVEDFKQQVAGLMHTVDKTTQIYNSRL